MAAWDIALQGLTGTMDWATTMGKQLAQMVVGGSLAGKGAEIMGPLTQEYLDTTRNAIGTVAQAQNQANTMSQEWLEGFKRRGGYAPQVRADYDAALNAVQQGRQETLQNIRDTTGARLGAQAAASSQRMNEARLEATGMDVPDHLKAAVLAQREFQERQALGQQALGYSAQMNEINTRIRESYDRMKADLMARKADASLTAEQATDEMYMVFADSYATRNANLGIAASRLAGDMVSNTLTPFLALSQLALGAVGALPEGRFTEYVTGPSLDAWRHRQAQKAADSGGLW